MCINGDTVCYKEDGNYFTYDGVESLEVHWTSSVPYETVLVAKWGFVPLKERYDVENVEDIDIEKVHRLEKREICLIKMVLLIINGTRYVGHLN